MEPLSTMTIEGKDFYQAYCRYKLNVKVKSDNTITIKKLKESWNREEVEKLLFQYDTFILNYHTKTQKLPLQKDIDKWIEQNL